MKVKHNGKVTEKTLDNIRASLIRRNKIEVKHDNKHFRRKRNGTTTNI
mgnify:FL=1